MLDQRGQLLRAAVGFAGCSLPSYDRALWALRAWLDSWSGIGHMAVGMHRQGYDLQLTEYDERGWRLGAAEPVPPFWLRPVWKRSALPCSITSATTLPITARGRGAATSPDPAPGVEPGTEDG